MDVMRQPAECMVIAGEPSGDQLAAELVGSLRHRWPGFAPRFFGAGGSRMAEAGVELAFDMTRHSVIGLVEALRRYSVFRNLFQQLVHLAVARRPDLILCVDFSGFNRRFARAIRSLQSQPGHPFSNWRPRIVQFISPQVWASRPGRVRTMEQDLDLLLSVFPFEKAWYRSHAPKLPVEFVGHPIADRYAHIERRTDPPETRSAGSGPSILLLPGSRKSELDRHLPPVIDGVRLVKSRSPAQFRMVLPRLASLDPDRRRELESLGVGLQEGGLAEALEQSTLAWASTGTVTLECAFFQVPTIAFYKTSWSTYQIGRRIIQVRYLAMPNLLADAPLLPELVQEDLTGERLADETAKLLQDAGGLHELRLRLKAVADSLGKPGACDRAAEAILRCLTSVG